MMISCLASVVDDGPTLKQHSEKIFGTHITLPLSHLIRPSHIAQHTFPMH